MWQSWYWSSIPCDSIWILERSQHSQWISNCRNRRIYWVLRIPDADTRIIGHADGTESRQTMNGRSRNNPLCRPPILLQNKGASNPSVRTAQSMRLILRSRYWWAGLGRCYHSSKAKRNQYHKVYVYVSVSLGLWEGHGIPRYIKFECRVHWHAPLPHKQVKVGVRVSKIFAA